MRKVKDAKDLSSNELIYFKGHAKATYMSDGTTVEDAIKNISMNGGIIEEIDPIFLSSPAATITEENKTLWNNKQDAISDIEVIRLGAAKGETALLEELYKGTITGITMNGSSKGTSGIIDLGNVVTDVSNKQDILISGSNIKTINGTSILGSGNIIISGSGEGSSSYGNAYPQINHGTSDTTFTLTPNTFHVWDEITSLDLDLGEEIEGIANEYLFQFTSGSTATTLSLPSDLKWANNSAPTIESNMIYQVSILKELASMLEFKNTTDFLVISSIYANNAKYAEVYEYFVNTYNLTSTSDSPSNGVIITETLTCDDPIVGGSVIKVSLNDTRLLLWTEKAINYVYVPAINNLGEYLNYMWD